MLGNVLNNMCRIRLSEMCPSLGVSHGAGQPDGDLHHDSPLNITTKLVFVLQIQEIAVTETKSTC